ncbi:hypothetical protein PISMIDRAFT_647232, partial [Pisolithus microcarpus 441]
MNRLRALGNSDSPTSRRHDHCYTLPCTRCCRCVRPLSSEDMCRDLELHTVHQDLDVRLGEAIVEQDK